RFESLRHFRDSQLPSKNDAVVVDQAQKVCRRVGPTRARVALTHTGRDPWLEHCPELTSSSKECSHHKCERAGSGSSSMAKARNGSAAGSSSLITPLLARVWGRAVRAVGLTREQTPVFQGSARRMLPLPSQKRSDNLIQMYTNISPDFLLNPAQFVVIIVSMGDHPPILTPPLNQATHHVSKNREGSLEKRRHQRIHPRRRSLSRQRQGQTARRRRSGPQGSPHHDPAQAPTAPHRGRGHRSRRARCAPGHGCLRLGAG